jgi:hypothetical protein
MAAEGRIPSDAGDLAQQLCLCGYHFNRSGRLPLESKADLQMRGEASRDYADTVVLTFARPVAPLQPEYHKQPKSLMFMTGHEHDDFAEER